jgi:hypothetical protein
MDLTPLFILSGPIGGGAPSRVLPFFMQYQQQLQWCWAATSVSVNLYFHSGSGHRHRQCTVANSAFSQNTCCANGAANACNRSWYLDRALQIVGNFDHMMVGRANLQQTVAEIDFGRPLCLRIYWHSRTGHFVALHGYSGTMVNVADPWWGPSSVDYYRFPEYYQTGGTWTHTYWVRP